MVKEKFKIHSFEWLIVERDKLQFLLIIFYFFTKLERLGVKFIALSCLIC